MLITDSELSLELINKFHLAAGVWRFHSSSFDDIILEELNPQASRQAPEKIKNALGQPLLEHFPELKNSPHLDKALEAWLTGEIQTIEDIQLPSGKPQDREWYRVSFIPVSGERVVLLYEDVTEKVRQRELLRRMAVQDPLTGTLNRRGIVQALEGSFARADRSDTYTAVLYFDLDGFKAVNDQHGHEAGDYLLVQVSKSVTDLLRGGDSLARMGGDEFAVICEQVRPEDSETLAQKILDGVSQPWTLPNGKKVTVGVSVGVAFARGRENDTESLIQQADQAMYVAKHAGGQRFCSKPLPQTDSRLPAASV